MQTYLAELKAALDTLNEQTIDAIAFQLSTSRMVFVIGNGGSASSASHIANDLGKVGNLPIISLVDVPTITAYANDLDYRSIYVEQLKRLAKPGDTLLAISCSGNSPNIIAAVEYAKEIGCAIVSLTGFDGGHLATLADINITVPGKVYDIPEDVHLSIGHMLTRKLRR